MSIIKILFIMRSIKDRWKLALQFQLKSSVNVKKENFILYDYRNIAEKYILKWKVLKTSIILYKKLFTSVLKRTTK